MSNKENEKSVIKNNDEDFAGLSTIKVTRGIERHGSRRIRKQLNKKVKPQK